MVRLENVVKQYGDLTVLDQVSLDVAEGEWVAITGPSGSGKTTLLNLLSGLDRPTSGSISVNGKDLSGLNDADISEYRVDTIGLVFQTHHLIPYLTAIENVMLAQYFHSLPDRTEATDALERIGLGERVHHRPGQLSGGEQQRVCIARALINEPPLVLADEPTGNLDRKNSERILDTLRELHQTRKFTLLLVTHDPFVRDWADRTLTLENGRLQP